MAFIEMEFASGGGGSEESFDITSPDKIFFWSGTSNKSSGAIPTDKKVKRAICFAGLYQNSSVFSSTFIFDAEKETAYRIGRNNAGNVNEIVNFSDYITNLTDTSITIKGFLGGTGTSYYGAALYY